MNNIYFIVTSIFLTLGIIKNGYADFQISFPVACELNENCWVVNYVDVDPAMNSAKDFYCVPRTYENHASVVRVKS